jgi:hypothetical protein
MSGQKGAGDEASEVSEVSEASEASEAARTSSWWRPFAVEWSTPEQLMASLEGGRLGRPAVHAEPPSGTFFVESGDLGFDAGVHLSLPAIDVQPPPTKEELAEAVARRQLLWAQLDDATHAQAAQLASSKADAQLQGKTKERRLRAKLQRLRQARQKNV